jgi:hypothetical protein
MPDNTNPAATAFTPLPDESAGAGVPLAKIATKQIAITKENIEKFGIPLQLVNENPVLVDLILKTESMKDDERKYWFQLQPIMTEEQIVKLQNILQNERDQLSELDAKYQAEVGKLNDKQALQFQAEKARQKREEIAKKEKANEGAERKSEEDILGQLKNL